LTAAVIESLPVLDAVPGIAARFLGRIPEVNVALERHESMALLAPLQLGILSDLGLGSFPLVTAEQVHGADIATVEAVKANPLPVAGADGLLTRLRGVTLGISVADCAPVWVVARDGSAGALLHSGRKGTALEIVTEGIRALCSGGSLSPEDLLVVIGPCIRPPCYDVDFAGEIRRQAVAAGVERVHDDRICTACHPERYYSYRREKGKTGRMLATLTLLPA
jgi:copper oxidase (laccase) domain-containing protein